MATVNAHIVGQRLRDGRPQIVARQGDDVRILDYEGALDWHVSEGCTCIGYTDDGHHPCPDEAEVSPQDRQCMDCFRGRGSAEQAGDMPQCIFEPLCNGIHDCACSFGKQPHAVYIAMYRTLPKVGMTGARRQPDGSLTRTIEQNADAYFVVAETEGRRAARDLEKRISMLHDIPEWRRSKEYLNLWTRPVPWDDIEQKAVHVAERVARHMDGPMVLHRTPHPLPRLPGTPRPTPVPGDHRGTWIGARGGLAFYEAAPTPGRLDVGAHPVMALKRADLIGRTITMRD